MLLSIFIRIFPLRGKRNPGRGNYLREFDLFLQTGLTEEKSPAMAAVQSQMVVSDHFRSKQILPFCFAEHALSAGAGCCWLNFCSAMCFILLSSFEWLRRPHHISAPQSRKAVSADLWSKQILPFGFAWRINRHQRSVYSKMPDLTPEPANSRRLRNGGFMLGQRRRRWPSMNTTLGKCPMFAGAPTDVNCTPLMTPKLQAATDKFNWWKQLCRLDAYFLFQFLKPNTKVVPMPSVRASVRVLKLVSSLQTCRLCSKWQGWDLKWLPLGNKWLFILIRDGFLFQCSEC